MFTTLRCVVTSLCKVDTRRSWQIELHNSEHMQKFRLLYPKNAEQELGGVGGTHQSGNHLGL
jgi:hypothetical protein